MDVARANEALAALYGRYHQKRTPEFDEISRNFYRPQLLRLPDSWGTATNRIAYVGQEPHGLVGRAAETKIETLGEFLESPNGVNELVATFDASSEEFHTGKVSQGNFWNYCKEIWDLTGRSEGHTCIVSSNLIRCAVKNQPAKPKREPDYTLWDKHDYAKPYLNWQYGLLAEELAILEPTLILFTTGPYYDIFIKGEYPDLILPVLDQYGQQFDALKSAKLPCPAYRTYHPQARLPVGFEPIRRVLRDAKLIP